MSTTYIEIFSITKSIKLFGLHFCQNFEVKLEFQLLLNVFQGAINI